MNEEERRLPESIQRVQFPINLPPLDHATHSDELKRGNQAYRVHGKAIKDAESFENG